MSERQFSRAYDEAFDADFDDALTDPEMPIPTFAPEADGFDDVRHDLPPGFADERVGPHPITTQAAFTSLTFRPMREPWYRSNAAKLALVGLGLATAVAAVVVLLWPTSTSQPAPADTSPSSPTATPTAPPSAPSADLPPAPAPPVGQPPDLPPPPPGPDPSADQLTPQAPRYYPRWQPTPTKKPEINVTRAPISVAPGVTGPQVPGGSAIPGNAPRHHGFF
jgi:hypothetical protein